MRKAPARRQAPKSEIVRRGIAHVGMESILNVGIGSLPSAPDFYELL